MFEPCLHGWKKGKTPFYNKKVSSWSDVWNLDKKELLEEMDLWKLDRDAQIKYQHPTQKPVSLCKRALIKSSRVGDIVVDFFAGSGSTLIGCEQMDRVCYTLEIDPLYCDVVRKRYSNFIGKGAEWQKTTPLISN
jgi:DNA modification methylase